MRAAAGAASFRRQSRLLELRRAAAERVAELRAELRPTRRRRAAAGGGARAAARERSERIAAALAAIDQLQTKADARAWTTDADAG